MRWLQAIVVVSLAGCSPEPAQSGPAAPLTVPPLASPSPPAAPTAARDAAAPVAVADAAPAQVDCTGDFPGPDMLRDNIADTSVSGLAEIVAVTKKGTNGQSPAPTTGYVNLTYDVKVVKWFAGSGRAEGERLLLHQGAEAPYNPAVGGLLFFSACALKDGSASEPDVGYFFAVSASCRAHAETAGEAAAKRAKAGGKKNRACKRP